MNRDNLPGRLRVLHGIRQLGEPSRLSVRCPACHHWAQMTEPGPDLAIDDGSRYVGFRVCPDTACSQFLICYYQVDLGRYPINVTTYPSERLPLDSSAVPDEIAACVQEAATCQSEGCYRAAALMVRRAIEIACELEGGTGGNLHDRIVSLSEKAVVSAPLIAGMHKLRILGNDAAHITAKEYEEIGAEEVGLALQVLVKLLDALYQNQALVQQLESLGTHKAEQLRALRDPRTPPPVSG